MAERIPSREIVGRATPKQIFEFGDKIHEKLKDEEAAKQAAYTRSGLISGGKLGQPTLWAVLDILGVPRDFDPYLLGKFRRGNDVEARAIDFLTGIDISQVEAGATVSAPETAILTGDFIWQATAGYRGGVGFVDLAQLAPSGNIFHEVKSATKMAYDKVAATGRSKGNAPEPYYHHCIQLAYYCIGEGVTRGFLHYFNADDYRLTSFAINPLDYKEEIDKEIDDIESVFLSQQLPSFEAFLPYHKAYRHSTYPEWNSLTPQQATDKLKREYPEAYKKLMGGIPNEKSN
jgi:hypothetical protein